MIYRIEKPTGSALRKDASNTLEFWCSDVRVMRFAFQDAQERKTVYDLVNLNAFPASNNLEFFALSNTFRYDNVGWDLYSPQGDLGRILAENNSWRISAANESYTICPTYPYAFAVPSLLDDGILMEASKLRVKGRLPVLTWVHPETQASITRSSQLNPGSSKEDILLKAIRESNARNPKLVVVDLRPPKTGNAGVVAPVEEHEGTEVAYTTVLTNAALRESHRILVDCCLPKEKEKGEIHHCYAGVEVSRWHEHVKSLLQTAINVVDLVHKQSTSVLIHCKDGMDQTPRSPRSPCFFWTLTTGLSGASAR